jgi:hypothetical protein
MLRRIILKIETVNFRFALPSNVVVEDVYRKEDDEQTRQDDECDEKIGGIHFRWKSRSIS